MNLQVLFQRFLEEKRYLKNLSQHTIGFYERAFKRFNLQEPVTKSQLAQRVTEMREAGSTAADVGAYIRGINPFLTWLYENEFLSEHIKVKRPEVEQRVRNTFSEAELKAIVSYKPSGLPRGSNARGALPHH
jgi:site-specific recombinase XerD